jgi:hypothetical protein
MLESTRPAFDYMLLLVDSFHLSLSLESSEFYSGPPYDAQQNSHKQHIFNQ